MRWLAMRKEDAGSDAPFMAYASRNYYEPGETVVLFARIGALDKDKDAGAEATVTARTLMPSGQGVTTALEYVAGSGGLYKADLACTEAGEYAAHVEAQKNARSLGNDTATFFLGKPYGEFDRVEMNERLLRALAFETGGAFCTPETASTIPDAIKEAASKRAILVERKFAHMPETYILMVLCASAEWYLRRRRGLL